MKHHHIAAHSLDRYNKAKTIINEGATVAAACKRARIAPAHFYRIRKTLKQKRRVGRKFMRIGPLILTNPPMDTATAIARLETRRDEADTAIRVLKSL